MKLKKFLLLILIGAMFFGNASIARESKKSKLKPSYNAEKTQTTEVSPSQTEPQAKKTKKPHRPWYVWGKKKKKEELPFYVKVKEFKIDAVDPTAKKNPLGKNKPGFRGENQLVIYTKIFGETTETDEYGIEAIVKNGKIDRIANYNSYIPQDGFVISGEGKAKTFMRTNMFEGASIGIDFKKGKLQVIAVPESYIIKAEKIYKRASDRLLKANPVLVNTKNMGFYLARSQKYIDYAKKFVRYEDYEGGLKFAKDAETIANTAFYTSIPYDVYEFKAMSVDTLNINVEDIPEAINYMSKAGIKNIFIDTFVDGYTIYPSQVAENYKLEAKNPTYNYKDENGKDVDLLETWITLAHKNDMKVYITINAFDVGNPGHNKKIKHIANVYPDWINVQKENVHSLKPKSSENDQYHYFLDPANPAPAEFLYKIADEAASKYKVDGININDLQYPTTVSLKHANYLATTWGYTKYARKEFKELHGIDPDRLTLANPKWEDWQLYKESKIKSFITNFVISNKKIPLTINILPEGKKVSQDWASWSFTNINAIIPQIYTFDEDITKQIFQKVRATIPKTVKVYAELYEPSLEGEQDDLLNQILISRQENLNGVVISNYNNFKQEFYDALRISAFREPKPTQKSEDFFIK